MKIRNGTGEHKAKIGEENEKKIRKWLQDNPNSTKKECSFAVGLSYPTVLLHIKNILSEEKG